jgi:hypothetical protein
VVVVNQYSSGSIHYRDRDGLDAQTRFAGLDFIGF